MLGAKRLACSHRPVGPSEQALGRLCLRAAVLVGLLAGAALGTVNLIALARWGWRDELPAWSGWTALVRAHGNAQLFGWTGLFIIGIAGHSLPRMLGRLPSGRHRGKALFGAVIALMLFGIVLTLIAEPGVAWAAAQGPAESGARLLGGLWIAGSACQWLAVTAFAAFVLGMVRMPREASFAWIAAGALWFWLGATIRLGLTVAAVRAGGEAPDAANAAYLHVMAWGFLFAWVFGYSQRLLPALAGTPATDQRCAWAALPFIAGGTVLEAVARALELPGLSVPAVALTGIGAALAVAAVRVWGRVVPAGARLGCETEEPAAVRLPIATSPDDPASVWLRRCARTAWGYFVVAALLFIGLRLAEAAGPVSAIHRHAFGGASRHAFTVGFVSLMIVGVAWRIVPVFSAATPPPGERLSAAFLLLVTGCTLRVGGQIAAGLWGGAAYPVMGASGGLETLALAIFALDVLRLTRGAPALPGARLAPGAAPDRAPAPSAPPAQ